MKQKRNNTKTASQSSLKFLGIKKQPVRNCRKCKVVLPASRYFKCLDCVKPEDMPSECLWEETAGRVVGTLISELKSTPSAGFKR